MGEFVNMNMDEGKLAVYVERIRPKLNDVEKLLSFPNGRLPMSNIMYGYRSRAQFKSMLEVAISDIAKLSETLTEIKKEIEAEDAAALAAQPLTLVDYKFHFESYYPYHQPAILDRPQFSIWDTVPPKANLEPYRQNFLDAIWLITNCGLGIDITKKQCQAYTYMAGIKWLHSKGEAAKVTPPTLAEGDRFNSMLYIAYQIRATPDYDFSQYNFIGTPPKNTNKQ